MVRKPNVSRRPCPICLDTDSKLTDEDVTPIWVRKILSELLPDPSKRPPRTRVRICSRCNSELNVKFEIPCKALVETLIRGRESVSLSLEQMTLVSAWTTKTTLVRLVADGSFQLDHETVDAARRELVELMETGRPSVFISLRIGYFSMEQERPHRLLLPPPRRFAVPHSVKNSDSFNANPSLGCLKWELLMSKTRQTASIQRLSTVQIDNDRLLRVWPLPSEEQEKLWPPREKLDLATVAMHAEAWRSESYTFYTQKTWRGDD